MLQQHVPCDIIICTFTICISLHAQTCTSARVHTHPRTSSSSIDTLATRGQHSSPCNTPRYMIDSAEIISYMHRLKADWGFSTHACGLRPTCCIELVAAVGCCCICSNMVYAQASSMHLSSRAYMQKAISGCGCIQRLMQPSIHTRAVPMMLRTALLKLPTQLTAEGCHSGNKLT